VRQSVHCWDNTVRGRRRPDLPRAAGRMHGMGDYEDVREHPDLCGVKWEGGVYLPRQHLHAAWNHMPGQPDRRHLCNRFELVPARSIDLHLHATAELRRQYPIRRVLVRVLRHLHARSNLVCERWPGDLYSWHQRLLLLQHARRLRGAPKLHGRGRVSQVHVQRRPRMRGPRYHVRQQIDTRHLLDGRARVQLPVVDDTMHARRVHGRCWPSRVLRQRVHGGHDAVRVGRGSDLPGTSQRMLRLDDHQDLRNAPDLHHVRERNVLYLRGIHLYGDQRGLPGRPNPRHMRR